MTQQTIVILTGAGVSAESGLATFRDQDGLWENHRIEDVATPEAFFRNPDLIQRFYNTRRQQLKGAQPNAAHKAIGKLYTEWPGRVVLITQNIDDLHERAMSAEPRNSQNALWHMHGELNQSRCCVSGQIFDCNGDLTTQLQCECCNKQGTLRPHIVWFGEMPLYMDEIYQALDECDLFLSIGTSGTVYPAAGFVHAVRQKAHGHTVELNLEPSHGRSLFHEHIYGPATKVVPEYVDKLLDKN